MRSRLMVITDRRATGGRPLAEVVARACEGGARLVQLREKDLDGGPLLTLARELRAVTARHGAELLVNDRIDVALASGADGVVLPASSFPTDVARRLLGPERMLGRSAHAPDEAARASAEGCDFALFGPVHATPSKAAWGEPQGIGRLRETCQAAAIPVYAVGGLDAASVTRARQAGAYGIAVIRAVLGAPDPRAATAALLAAIDGAAQ